MSREQFWFFYPLRVRYSEVDCQGVVFNANYLMYFDTTITEYFRALGYDQQADAKKTGVDFHVVKSLIEYKAPVRFDQEIDVGARVARIGNSSLVFELAIFLKDGIDALVTGEIVWVYTSQQTHRPVPIPESIREHHRRARTASRSVRLLACRCFRSHPRHCEERSDEAIHSATARDGMDCFAPLAMTGRAVAVTGMRARRRAASVEARG